MTNSGLTENEILNIQQVFSNYPAVENALLYGSRAMGNFNPTSDIDITLKGNNIDLTLLNQIELDLDDLMLPYKFDVSIYHKIANQDLINHITREGKQIYSKKHYKLVHG